MTERWSSEPFCNRWLREQSLNPSKSETILNLPMQEQSELESVLAAIRRFENRTNCGKVRIVIHRGTISISIRGSKEMFI